MATVFRKALAALPRMGVQVLDLGPGAAVVSRRERYTATKLAEDSWKVDGRGPAVRDPADCWGLHKSAASDLCARHVAELLAR
jgi:hypothetical protein